MSVISENKEEMSCGEKKSKKELSRAGKSLQKLYYG